MRKKLLATLMIGIFVVMGMAPLTLGQFRQGGNSGSSSGGKGGFGKGGGGFGKGGFSFGGGGMPSSATLVTQDPAGLFDRLAKGRDHFLISETFTLRESLNQFAKDKGIADEKINRANFLGFAEQLKAKMGATGASPAGAIPGGAPGGMTMTFKKPDGSAASEADVAAFRIEFEFRRLDGNSDGVLNTDEMPDSLREDLARWDRNSDRVIDLAEYRNYAQARNQARTEAGFNRGPDTEVIEINSDDLDRRPVVYRAGKLPKELEALFKELDQDVDGNIDLAEWRGGGRSIADFKAMDRNEDGLLTSEEILRHQNRPATAQAGDSGNQGFRGRGGFGGGGSGGSSGGNPWGRFKRN